MTKGPPYYFVYEFTYITLSYAVDLRAHSVLYYYSSQGWRYNKSIHYACTTAHLIVIFNDKCAQFCVLNAHSFQHKPVLVLRKMYNALFY